MPLLSGICNIEQCDIMLLDASMDQTIKRACYKH